MPCRPRVAAGDLAYHVLNRRVGRLPLFENPADYAAFEEDSRREQSRHLRSSQVGNPLSLASRVRLLQTYFSVDCRDARSSSSAFRISAGRGGQPGMRRSTGTWRSTGPVTP